MELKDLNTLVEILSATPGVMILLGLYFFFEFRALKREVHKLKLGMTAIQNNGFVHKNVLEEKEKVAKVIHEALEGRIERLEVKLDGV